MKVSYYGAYNQLTPKDIADGIEVRWAGCYRCGPQYMIDRIHKRYFLIYVVKGSCRYRAPDGNYIDLIPGDMVFYRPYEPQWLKNNPDDPVTYVGVCFSGYVLDTILKTCRIFELMHWHQGVDNHLVHLFSEMIHEILVNKNSIYLLGLLLHLIGVIEKDLQQDEEKEESVSEGSQNLKKAVNYMLTNYNKKITVSEVSLVAGYSISRFQYLFKKQYGMSVTEFLINERIQRAKELLHHDLSPMNEIAYSVGFSDPYYFSKMFKKRVGMSPRAYRNSKTAEDGYRAPAIDEEDPDDGDAV